MKRFYWVYLDIKTTSSAVVYHWKNLYSLIHVWFLKVVSVV